MKGRKGFVLVIALTIISTLTIVGVTTTYFIMQQRKLSVDTLDSIKALKAAESGVEIALANLKRGEIKIDDCNGTLDNPIVNNTIPVNNATYSVNVTDMNMIGEGNGCFITLNSMGEKNGAIREIDVKVFVNKTDNNSITIEFWRTY
jgi:Tfp pilus assembly protein PilX